MELSSIFVLSFLARFIFCRVLLYLKPALFKKPYIKSLTGLQIHHYHYGLLLVVIAVFLLLLDGKEQYSIVLLGVGVGLLLDEATTAMLIPSQSDLEFRIYKQSFASTAVLFCCVSLLILLLRKCLIE